MNINQSINHIIHTDIYNLIYSLNHIYNINNLQLLLNRYIPNININTTSPIIIKKKKYKKSYSYIPNQSHRCKARCWGGKKSVKYNPINKKWSYGTQCKRYKLHNSMFCKTHHNISLSSYGLTHGTITQQPPHPHYNKYKLLIINKYNIK